MDSCLSDISDINNLLEMEKQNNKNESWNKLDKSMKIQKLHGFAEKYGRENSLPMKIIKSLKIQDLILRYLDLEMQKKEFNHMQKIQISDKKKLSNFQMMYMQLVCKRLDTAYKEKLKKKLRKKKQQDITNSKKKVLN